MTYESVLTVESQIDPGVSYSIARISFARRVELMRHVRELAGRLEFVEAGSTDQDKMAAGILSAEIDRLYVRWGLLEVRGLSIDGAPATPESLAGAGPEDLFMEALHAVK
jgi:hypothetical protein